MTFGSVTSLLIKVFSAYAKPANIDISNIETNINKAIFFIQIPPIYNKISSASTELVNTLTLYLFDCF